MLLGNDTLLAVRDSFASYTALDVDSMIPWTSLRKSEMRI